MTILAMSAGGADAIGEVLGSSSGRVLPRQVVRDPFEMPEKGLQR